MRNLPPRVAGVCDVCGAKLVQRKDDNPDTIRTRLAVFRADTAPLVDWYAARNLLIRIDGSGEAGSVNDRIVAALK